jgi:type II secretory pathway component GspD/PulD (secretin)
MLFVHPKIIRSKETSRELSLSRYKYMRENQKDFRGKVDTLFLGQQMPALPTKDRFQPEIPSTPEQE